MSQGYEDATVLGWLDPWGGCRSPAIRTNSQELATVHIPLSNHRLVTRLQRSLLCQSPESPRGEEENKDTQCHEQITKNTFLILEFILRKLYLCHTKKQNITSWNQSPRDEEILLVTRSNRGEPPAPTPVRERTEWWMKWEKKSSNTGTEPQVWWGQFHLR